MRNIFSLNDTLTNKISFYHLVLFLTALPFDQFYSHIVLISFALHTIFHLQKADLRRVIRKEAVLLTSVFFLSLILSFYTSNKTEAYKLISRQAPIVILPLLLLLNSLDLKRYRTSFLLVLATVSCLLISYLYIDAFRVIRYYELPLSSIFSTLFMNHHFSEPVNIHATYLSLYIALSLISLVSLFFKAKARPVRLIYILAICLLTMGLLQLGSRASVIAVLVFLCFVMPAALKGRHRVVYLYSVFLAMLVVGLLIFKVDAFRLRFVDDLKEDLSNQSSVNSLTDSRYRRWNLAFDLVQESPVIGYGSGDEVDLLREKYFQHQMFDAYLHKLNAHNQYLSFLLAGGFTAFLAYLLTLGLGMKLAIRWRDVVFVGFLIILLTVSMSENLLHRNKGIFFYSFFFSLFILSEVKFSSSAFGRVSDQKSRQPDPGINRLL